MMRALLASALIAMSFAGPAMAQTRVFPDDAKLLELIKSRVDDGRATGLVLGVMDADGSVRVVSYGDPGAGAQPFSANSVFEIGSVTKVFTTTLLADMVQKGEVSLDAPAQQYAPAGMTLPTRNGKAITLAHLAEQNSGLPRLPDNMSFADMSNPYADYTAENLNTFLAGHTLRRDPGAEFEYSNLGMGLLGNLLANRAGQTYEQLVTTRVLDPLDMQMTGITLTPEMRAYLAKGHSGPDTPAANWDLPSLAGAGALRSTMNDLMKFVDANLGEPKTDLERAMRRAQQPRFPISTNAKIGLGWITVTTKNGEFIYHDGGTGGYGAIVGIDQKRGIGVVLLGNRTLVPEDIAMHLFDPSIPLTPKSKPTSERAEISVPAETLASYAGVYALDAMPDFKLTVTLESGQLQVQATQQPKFAIFAESATKFFYKVVDAQLTFVPAADGTPAHLILHQAGTNQKATKQS
jgi:D-alanyl-D-alanine-carboxypeptidase/D-alanyl-D-alanine-endopeptidase